MTARGIFVTGTDTEVGKTHFACRYIRGLVKQGVDVGVYKPVASGFKREEHQSDASRLHRSLGDWGSKYRLEEINPQYFLAPLAPPLAAQAEERIIDESLLEQGASRLLEKCDFLVVEGAGGLFSPMTWALTNADLALRLGFDLVIVTENRLGCIHQILSTVKAAQSVGLTIRSVVLNQIRMPREPVHFSNQELLTPFLKKFDPGIEVWLESYAAMLWDDSPGDLQ